MSGDNPFDISHYSPRNPVESAADEVTRAELAELFEKLRAADALWVEEPIGPRRAALAALGAVVKFADSHAIYGTGDFARSLRALAGELHNSPPPLSGNILPPADDRQSVEHSRRSEVNRLKAYAAHVAQRVSDIGGTRGMACNAVAKIFLELRFPPSDYMDNDGAAKEAEDVPTSPQIASRVEEWCKRYPEANNEPGREYRRMVLASPLPVHDHLSSHDAQRLLINRLKDEIVAARFGDAKR